MNNICSRYVSWCAVFALAFLSIDMQAQPAPPVIDTLITVCEGESTLLVPGSAASAPVLLGFNDFDSATNVPLLMPYTSTGEFNDGVNDHFGVTDGGNISNVSGPYSFQDGTNRFFAAEDIDDTGLPVPGVLTFDPVTITGFKDITFCFDIAAGNNNPAGANAYDKLDYVRVEGTVDGVLSTTSMLFSYQNNGDDFNEPLHHDPNGDGDGSDGVVLTVTGQEFCFTLPNTDTDGKNQVVYTISVAMNAAREEVAFDNISVTGVPLQSVVFMEDFEGAAMYVSSGEFNDGVNDHFGKTDGSNISNTSGPYSFTNGGTYFFAAEDVDDNGGPGVLPATLKTNPISLSGLTSMNFCFDMAVGNENGPGASAYDATDYVTVVPIIDNVASPAALCFNYIGTDGFNEPFAHDTNCDGIGDGTVLQNAGQQFCFEIADADIASMSNIEFEIRVSMNSAREEIAFDNILVSAIVPPVLYNFYDGDPTAGGTLLAGPVQSYDPMTTIDSSPQSIWVTAVDGAGNESTAVEVVIVVNPILNVVAGDDVLSCGLSPIMLNATLTDGAVWIGGAGMFDDTTSATATYTPVTSEVGVPFNLIYRVRDNDCGKSADTVRVSIVEEALDPEFSYPLDTVCPGNGTMFPLHNTGTDGVYSVTGGDPALIDLDAQTGAINIGNTADGTYNITNTTAACGNMLITGVFDATLPGGIPKGIELFVANDIPDLSIYGVGSANNGGGTDGQEFVFPAVSASKGDYIYIASEVSAFTSFFGFAPNYTSNAMFINGDDAIELFCKGNVIDVFGDINVDGSGESWEYTNGWAYRVNNATINGGAFESTQFMYSGVNALNGATTNAAAGLPVPLGQFNTTYMGVCPNRTHTVTVTIGDYELPMFVCPNDVTIGLDAGECGIAAEVYPVDVSDNCTPDIEFVQISGPVTGDYLYKDESPYTVVFQAIEDNGNVVECSYQIFIEEFKNPISTLACNNNINVSLDQNCNATLTADMLLEGGPYGCYDDYQIVAKYNGASVGQSIPATGGTGNYLVFDNTYLGVWIEVSIIDPETNIYCWGNVRIEDKLAPVLVCSNDTINCGEDTTPVEPMVIENCSGYELSMSEKVEIGTCTDPFASQIIRVWSVMDGYGNVGDECTQVISIRRQTLDSLVLPKNFDGLPGGNPVLVCDGDYEKDGIGNAVNADGNPSPSVTGEPGGVGLCGKFVMYYTDVTKPLCDESCSYTNGSYQVIRKWNILDWCTSQSVEHTQVINVMDTLDPVIDYVVIENRGEQIKVKDGDAVTIYTDLWGCTASYKVVDVVGTDNCSAQISSNDLNTVEVIEKAKCAQIERSVSASDCCGNTSNISFIINVVDNVPPTVVAETFKTVTLTTDGVGKILAESFDDGSHDGCGKVGFAVRRKNPAPCQPVDVYPPAGDDNKQFNEMVHFCCQDASDGQDIEVEFMVCDDANCDGLFDFKVNAQNDNCNVTVVKVRVQDKLAPSIVCPENTTVSCIDVSGIDWENDALVDNLFGKPEAAGTCNVEVSRSVAVQLECPDGLNNLGVVVRSFTATNEAGSNSCQQIITVTGTQTSKLTCDRIGFDLDAPIFDQLSSSNKRKFWFDDPTQPDPYFGFESHWCAVNDNVNDDDDDIPALKVDCGEGFSAPQVLVDIDGLCTEAGISMKFDTFNFAGGACKKYLVKYEVIDQCVFDENFVDPITGEINPYNSANGYFTLTLEIDAFDNEGPVLACEDVTLVAASCTGASGAIKVGGSDNCTASNYWGFQWRIDVNADNTIDYPASGWYNSDTASPELLGLSEFPIGDHIIYWVVSDGCGNVSTCAQKLTVSKEEKAPTPYCHSGIAITLMETGMVEVWASDLNAGSFDNCTNAENLIYSFSEDMSETAKTFTCDDIGFQFVEIWVTDGSGNQDKCNTIIMVQENDVCNTSSSIMIEGEIFASNGYKNENAKLMIDHNGVEFKVSEADEQGAYEFGLNNVEDDMVLTPQDNSNVLMGVTTLDIIMIQKHILGIKPFKKNVTMIAADVNNDNKITGSDIVQIRRLILGLTESFPNSDSWTFYPDNLDVEALPNPYTMSPSLQLKDATNYDFHSIKIGDVSMSEKLYAEQIDTRSSNVIYVDEIENEGIWTYVFKPGSLNGMLEGAELTIMGANNTNINSGGLDLSQDAFVSANGLLKISALAGDINSDVLFTLTSDNRLNLSLSAEHNQELYVDNGTMEVQRVELVLNKPKAFDFSIAPNPFVQETQIELYGAFSPNTHMIILDASGKVVYKAHVAQNVIRIGKEVALDNGVYFVQIASDDVAFTKKLIKIN